MRSLIIKKSQLVLSVIFSLILVACSATFDFHGYTPSDEELEQIIVGVDDKSSVEAVIGVPQSRSMLRDNGWYYISSKVRNFAYQEPQIIERQLVAISFDNSDIVTNIERFALEDGRVITLNRRVTELPVKGPGFIRQLLGNLGNLNPAGLIDEN